MQIAVCGSSEALNAENSSKAKALGRAIARSGCLTLTGACWGLPYEVVLGAKEEKGMTIGISPAANLEEHIDKYKLPSDFSSVIFTGFGYKGRNVITVRSADAVIFLPGRIGTLNEFTIAIDEGKLIGVLGTELISQAIPSILTMCGKNDRILFYEDEPITLVNKLISKYKLLRKDDISL